MRKIVSEKVYMKPGITLLAVETESIIAASPKGAEGNHNPGIHGEGPEEEIDL